jgi:perosamine synthetase
MRQGISGKRIPVAGPWITQKEVEYVADAAAHAWYENARAYQDRFEKAFAEYVGVRCAVCLPSCTSAIHLSLLALGIGAGDEVIVPDITWIASAAPITYVGATPVFADIDPETWCLSASAFEACLTPRTRAVIPVDLYGMMPDLAPIQRIARRHGVAVIEDAAEAIGSEYTGRKAGSLGDTGVFSFHGSKTLTTGEGGMLVTDRAETHQRVLFLRDHGRDPGGRMFWNTEVAYKYRMSSLQAALGLAQLERIEELLARKRQIVDWYRRALAGVKGLTLPRDADGARSVPWMVTVIVAETFGVQKEGLIEEMRAHGIECRPFFYPLSSLPAYAHLAQAREASRRNTVSYRLSPYGINLPSGLMLTREAVAYVCETLNGLLHHG